MFAYQMLSLVLLLLVLGGLNDAKSEFNDMSRMEDLMKGSRFQTKQALDSIDGSEFSGSEGDRFRIRKRLIDLLESAGFGMEKRALDALEGEGFGMKKRALDSLEGEGFGMEKRALDALEGEGFGMKKRALDSLEGEGFGMEKRALDALEGEGFGLRKRALDALEGEGFGLKKRTFASLGGFGMKKQTPGILQGKGYGIGTKAINLKNEGFDRLQNRPFQFAGLRTKQYHMNRHSTTGRHSRPNRMDHFYREVSIMK